MSTECSSDEEYLRKMEKNKSKRKRERYSNESESPPPRMNYGHRSVSPEYDLPRRSRSRDRTSRSRDWHRERSGSRNRSMKEDNPYLKRRSAERSVKAAVEGDKGRQKDSPRTAYDRDNKVEERAREKLSVLAKLGIEMKLPEQAKKKKLWNTEKSPSALTTWKAASFADGKVTAKFQRLMGIKNGVEDKGEMSTGPAQNQEQLFKRMEAEYEVARQATHTLRGAGLGFSK